MISSRLMRDEKAITDTVLPTYSPVYSYYYYMCSTTYDLTFYQFSDWLNEGNWALTDTT